MGMVQSFKEYLAAFGKWGFAIAALLIGDLFGIYQSYNSKFVLPQWAWLLILAVILVMSPVIAFHKLRLKRDELKRELDNIKNGRPKIETTIRGKHDDFDIEVLNTGEDAEFEAQIEVIQGQGFVLSLPQNYTAYWEKTKNDKVELKKGQRDWLKIASLEVHTHGASMNFLLHYYEITNFQHSTFPRLAYANSTGWIPGNPQVVKPRISLKITISSKPSMIGGAFVKNYQLSDNGLSEVNS
ncbi:MAG: hypothetical protein V1823_03885 [Chloroflexota bacterium]